MKNKNWDDREADRTITVDKLLSKPNGYVAHFSGNNLDLVEKIYYAFFEGGVDALKFYHRRDGIFSGRARRNMMTTLNKYKRTKETLSVPFIISYAPLETCHYLHNWREIKSGKIKNCECYKFLKELLKKVDYFVYRNRKKMVLVDDNEGSA